MIEAIIYDFDGVIGDSEVLANAVLAEMVSELGHPTTLQDSYRTYMGKRLEDVLATIAQVTAKPLPADFMVRFQTRTRDALAARLQPVTGARAYLEEFSALPRAVASSSAPERLAVCLKALDLEAYFGARVFSASMVPRGKPHPDIFLHAAGQIGIAPRACLVIEDSAGGVRAAKAAGMTALGLLAASHIQAHHTEDLRAAGADALAHSYGEAAEFTRSRIVSAAAGRR